MALVMTDSRVRLHRVLYGLHAFLVAILAAYAVFSRDFIFGVPATVYFFA